MHKETQLLPLLQPNKLQVTEFHDHIRYDYYLMGAIGDPEDYVDVCHALRSCAPGDEFFLRLNSMGGQVRSGNQLINAINECQGTVIGFIESDCGSMATFLFLACHTWGVSKYAEWFSHTISAGNWGKENETFEASQFLRKQTHKRIREEYKGFLSDEEIESVLKGSDIYLDADQIMDRLENFVEYRESLPCNCGDEMCGRNQEQEEMPTLSELVQEAVEKALDSRDKKAKLAEKRAAKKPTPKLQKALTEAKEISEYLEKAE